MGGNQFYNTYIAAYNKAFNAGGCGKRIGDHEYLYVMVVVDKSKTQLASNKLSDTYLARMIPKTTAKSMLHVQVLSLSTLLY